MHDVVQNKGNKIRPGHHEWRQVMRKDNIVNKK